MIDIHTEEIGPLKKAANKWVPTRPNVSTVWRWVTRGVRGEKLESVRVGGVVCTSRQAIERFLARLNGGAAVTSTQNQTREREIAAAEARLAAAGVR